MVSQFLIRDSGIDEDFLDHRLVDLIENEMFCEVLPFLLLDHS
jgi:hypothetical protein